MLPFISMRNTLSAWQHYLTQKVPNWFTLVLVFAFFFYSFVIPVFGNSDQEYWLEWTTAIQNFGLGAVYHESGANYPPAFLYVLALWGRSSQLLGGSLSQNFGLLRSFVLVFDILTLFILGKILQKINLSRWPILLMLLNIGWLYNTLIWRQVDAVFTFFLVLTVYLLLSKKILVATLCFLVALNTKVQSIVFLPTFLLVLADGMDWHHSRKTLGSSLLSLVRVVVAVVVLQCFLLLPFFQAGTLQLAWYSVTQSVDYYPVISANAYNFWVALLSPDIIWSSDAVIISHLSYKQWGLLLFGVASFISLLPLAALVWKRRFTRLELQKKWEITSASTALTFGAFFLFNTQMHERYMHPAIVFCALFALVSRKKWSYLWVVVWSFLYFLNLEVVNFAFPAVHIIEENFLIITISNSYLLMFMWALFWFYHDYFWRSQ